MAIARALPYIDDVGVGVVQEPTNVNDEIEIVNGKDLNGRRPWKYQQAGSDSIYDQPGEANPLGNWRTQTENGLYTWPDGGLKESKLPQGPDAEIGLPYALREGSIKTQNGEGTNEIQDQDGRRIIIAEGRTIRNADGSASTEYSGGIVVNRKPDESISSIKVPSGATVSQNGDGTITTQYPDGHKETHDPKIEGTENKKPDPIVIYAAAAAGLAVGAFVNIITTAGSALNTVGEAGKAFCRLGGC